jgi:hypothetical protein
LIPNRHESYISWDQFEKVSHMMANNSQKCFASSPGAPCMARKHGGQVFGDMVDTFDRVDAQLDAWRRAWLGKRCPSWSYVGTLSC